MPIRPSKIAFNKKLAEDLKHIQNGVGIDAASAGMKNSALFKTDVYIGIDNNMEALTAGLARDTRPNVYGFLADLCKLPQTGLGPQPNSAHVVVSTHTMEHLSKESQPGVVSALANLVRPGGYFLINIQKVEPLQMIEGILRKQFSKITIMHYRDPVSRLFEWLVYFVFKLKSETAPCWLHRMAYYLSYTAVITKLFPAINSNVYYFCQKSGDSPDTTTPPLDNDMKAGDRLYVQPGFEVNSADN